MDLLVKITCLVLIRLVRIFANFLAPQDAGDLLTSKKGEKTNLCNLQILGKTQSGKSIDAVGILATTKRSSVRQKVEPNMG